MTLLFDIPSDLLRELLDEWLPIKSVGCLDSACCSHQTRNTFLLQLRHVTTYYRSSSIIIAYCDFYNWVNLRKLILSELFLYDDMFNSNLNLKFSFDNSRVTRIMLQCYDKKYLKGYVRVINSCDALVQLDCNCENSSDGLFQGITNLNNLVRLTLGDENDISATKSLSIVAKSCTKLEAIAVLNSYTIPTSRIYKLLFEKNPRLKSVDLRDDVLEQLTNCKNIETITLDYVDLLNFEHLIEVIKVKTLKFIQISGENTYFYYDSQLPGHKSLRLEARSDMTDELLAKFIDSVPNLNDLSLSGFNELPESLVDNNAASLTACDFGAIKLTVDNLNNLFERCVHLISLTLSIRCIPVDVLICQNMRRLERLHVCDATLNDILAIIRSFTWLRKFSFSCYKFPKSEIKKFKSQLHKLDVQSGRNIRCDILIAGYILDYQHGRFGGESDVEYLTVDEIEERAANNDDKSWLSIFD